MAHPAQSPSRTIGRPAASPTARAARVIETIDRIDRRLARLESALERAEALGRTLPGAVAGAVDTLDDIAEQLGNRGVDVDARLRSLASLAERLTSPGAVHRLNRLLENLSALERALSAARLLAPQNLGLWRVARAMSDEDVRRAVVFLVTTAKVFGRALMDRKTPAERAQRELR